MDILKYCKLCRNHIFAIKNASSDRLLDSDYYILEQYLQNSICESCYNFIREVQQSKRLFVYYQTIFLRDTFSLTESSSICSTCFQLQLSKDAFVKQGESSITLLKYIFEKTEFHLIKLGNTLNICGHCWEILSILYHFKAFCSSLEILFKLNYNSSTYPPDIYEQWVMLYRNIRKWDTMGSISVLPRSPSYEDVIVIDDDDDDDSDNSNAAVLSHSRNLAIFNNAMKDFYFQSEKSRDSDVIDLTYSDDESENIIGGNVPTNTHNNNFFEAGTSNRKNYDCASTDNDVSIDEYLRDIQAGESDVNVVDTEVNVSFYRLHLYKYYVWECHICISKFPNRKGLRRHLLAHEDPWNKFGRFSCSKCVFKTSWKGCITKHENLHMKYEKGLYDNIKSWFMCPFCSKTDSVKQNIIVHAEKHSLSWNKFKCLECDYSIDKAAELRVHYKNLHLRTNS